MVTLQVTVAIAYFTNLLCESLAVGSRYCLSVRRLGGSFHRIVPRCLVLMWSSTKAILGLPIGRVPATSSITATATFASVSATTTGGLGVVGFEGCDFLGQSIDGLG